VFQKQFYSLTKLFSVNGRPLVAVHHIIKYDISENVVEFKYLGSLVTHTEIKIG
jgi:hypothetical protein